MRETNVTQDNAAEGGSGSRTGAKAIIVDYDAGNLRSVQRACQQVGLPAIISRDPEALLRAERVIFPGVGAAGAAMASLQAAGLDAALLEFVASGRPMLGICLGLQISLDRSEENEQKTLGILPGVVRRFRFDDPSLKVPHMGWNQVVLNADNPICANHPVVSALQAEDEFYFVHGYYAQPKLPEHLYASTEYEHSFASVIGYENYVATQFHLEKSGRAGLRLLDAFARWDGTC